MGDTLREALTPPQPAHNSMRASAEANVLCFRFNFTCERIIKLKGYVRNVYLLG